MPPASIIRNINYSRISKNKKVGALNSLPCNLFCCKIGLMKKNIYFKAFALALALSLTFTLFSCTSAKAIPEDLTAPQLLQKGQASLDAADYKTAERYFLKTIEKYGDDTNTYIEAKYELAHLYVRTKNYRKAYYALDEILELYDYAAFGSLPAAYKKLAQIEMAKIPENKIAEFQAEAPQAEDR